MPDREGGRLVWWLSTALLVVLSALELQAAEKQSVFFDLGPKLVEEFHGSYEFRYKKVEFIRNGPGAYTVLSSGDQSPSKDKLVQTDDQIEWILGGSGEQWLAFRNPLRPGEQWPHMLRDWKQRYKVDATDLTVTVPAGQFQHCAKVSVTWIADERDMTGPQRRVLYLAPHLFVVKEEHWSNGVKYHEETLSRFSSKSISPTKMK